MKLKGFGIIAAVAFLAACSSDTVDVATTLDESLKDATDIVSFEGRSFVGEDISIDFVGAKTALAKIDFIDEVVEDEVLCSYRATRDSLILQVKKAPLGDDGRLYSEEEFIRMWNSDSWRIHSIGYVDGEWVEDDFETETVKTSSEKTSEKESSTSSIEFEFTYDDEDGETVTGAKATVKGVAVANGEKTTTVITRTYTAEVANRASTFYTQFSKLSNDNWSMVHSIFLPYHFTYETHKSVDESLMGDESPEQKKEQTYDLFLTQHYTSMRNSSFVNVDMLDETFFMSYLDMTSGGIKAFVDNGDTTGYVYNLVSIDSKAKTMAFEQYNIVGETDFEEVDDDDTIYAGSITANYTLEENGDNSKIVLSFGKGKNADGKESNLYISGKTLTFEFGNTTLGLNEITE